jgi:hypothetical protein
VAKPEPFNLREWVTVSGRLFTCGRPGRATYNVQWRKIEDNVVEAWVSGLLARLPRGPVHLVSLLGWKKDTGESEFWYYTFRSNAEDGAKPTIQAWLDQKHPDRFVVAEFRTRDYQDMTPSVLQSATECVRRLLAIGATVVMMDSAGCSRTGAVRNELGLIVERLPR